MTVSLSLSCNTLINRINDPAELVQVCTEEIGVRRIQLTNEFINPVWPAETQARLARQFTTAASRHGLQATSLMTGAQARLAAMGHSDEGVRAWTEDWFIKFGRIAADLGAASIGSQFAILSWSDWDDPARREGRITRILDGWCRIWEAVERFGLKELFWEQMSIGREFGHTIPATADLVGLIERRGIPLRILLDVDHGDITSADANDTDPYAWIRAFGRDCPILHVKQSSANKGGHWPFVEPYNSTGRIRPSEIVSAMTDFGPSDSEVCLELSFREREPADRSVVQIMRDSVNHWRPHLEV